MKILQINTADNRGGAAKIAFQLHTELKKADHKMNMFVGRKYSNDPDVFILNDTLSFSGKVRRKLAYWLANDMDVFSSNHILKTKEFKEADIVHCHNLHSNYFNLGTLKKMAKLKPIVWTFHDMWPLTAHCAHSFDGKMKKTGFFACPSLEIYPPIAWHNEKYLENRKRNIYNSSQFHIVTVSQWLEQKVKQSLLGSKSISTIYNGVDTSIFKPHSKEECRKKIGLPLDKKIVLSVIKGGLANPWKGANYITEIIKRLGNADDILLVAIGRQEKAGNVLIVPYVQSSEILAQYYSAADIMIYPSIADTFGLVAAEAQACGLPVVSFATGGIPEIVNHQKTGYIARYKNVDDLITGIQWMLSRSSVEQTTMRQAAAAKIRSGFTLEKMADQYLNLYKKEVENFNLVN